MLKTLGTFGYTIGTLAGMIAVSWFVLRARPSAAVYHALVYFTFLTVYLTIPGGFKNHFNVPDKTPLTAIDIGYYTAVTHTGVGYGDIYPTTTAARLLVTSHLLLAVLAIFDMLPFEALKIN